MIHELICFYPDGIAWINEFGHDIKDHQAYMWGYKDLEIEEFTGVIDCDFGEVYEGDIIEDSNHGIVKRRFLVEDIRTLTREFDKSEHGSDWKVIGNIHENPELLDTKEVK
jgi:uncharacterized phage protein (TIGR01671 family)